MPLVTLNHTKSDNIKLDWFNFLIFSRIERSMNVPSRGIWMI